MTQQHAVQAGRDESYTRVRGPEILATTVELVRGQGLSNVRVVDVAERAGTSPTSVIYYFASKDQLFEQLLEHPGRTRAHYVSMSLKAAAIKLGCDESASQQGAAGVPVPVASPPSNPEGAE